MSLVCPFVCPVLCPVIIIIQEIPWTCVIYLNLHSVNKQISWVGEWPFVPTGMKKISKVSKYVGWIMD